jgi:hypothetical protein
MSVKAFAFHADHDFAQIRNALTSRGAISWRGGDSEVWGEYLVARVAEGRVKLRVFVDGQRFVFEASSYLKGTDFDDTVSLVRSDLLPLLGAREIEDHPGWE